MEVVSYQRITCHRDSVGPRKREWSKIKSVQLFVRFLRVARYANGSQVQSSRFPISDEKSPSWPYVEKHNSPPTLLPYILSFG